MEHQQHLISHDRVTEIQANINNIEQEVLNTLLQLEDPHSPTARQWIFDLINQHLNEGPTPLLNSGLIFSITVIDNIVAKLLNLNNIEVIKAKMLRRYLKNLWKINDRSKEILIISLVEENEVIEIA